MTLPKLTKVLGPFPTLMIRNYLRVKLFKSVMVQLARIYHQSVAVQLDVFYKTSVSSSRYQLPIFVLGRVLLALLVISTQVGPSTKISVDKCGVTPALLILFEFII